MAQGDTPITLVGNLVAEPELRYTPSNSQVANFRVASTPRRFNSQTNQWEDGEALFLSCAVWHQAAENVANSLHKGMRVIVTGRLRQRSYEDKNGERRTVFEIDVDEVGPSLKYASAEVSRNPREGGNGGGYGNGNFGGGNGGYNNGGGYNGGGFGGNTGGNNYGGGNGGFGGGNDRGGFGGQGSRGDAPANDPWASAPDAGNSGIDKDNPPF